MKLTTKLFIQIMASLIAVVLPLSAYQLYVLLQNSDRESYEENLRALRAFSSPVADALWGLDNNYIQQLATSLALTGSVTRVEIYDEDLNVFIAVQQKDDLTLTEDRESHLLTSTQLSKFRIGESGVYKEEVEGQEGNNVRMAIPIFSVQGMAVQPSFYGVLAIEYSLESVNSQVLSRILNNALLIIIFTSVVSAILFFSLKRSVLNPLYTLIKAMQEVPENRTLRLSPEVSNTTEFARIFETFNYMVEELEEKDALINEQRKQMVQASKMSALGEMAAGIAHEINNPLAIIVGYNHIVRELLKRDQNSNTAEISRNLAKIQETTDRISKIIQGLRSFSRNSAGDARKWSDLKSLIENTMEFCAQRFKNHGIDLIVEPIPPVEIFCRDSQIIQVLLNLLNNAFDAIQDGPDHLWIRIGFERFEDKLEIRITDSGPGIPNEVADKVMQPFFTTKEVGKGTGLGLSISNGIIEEHGGQLYLQKDSPNTQFVVEFPQHIFRETDAPTTLLSGLGRQ